ncbi:hypothetical protein BD414DRAFT_468058 [Trametes punicea]|nr:hypothetical protein BD414DRAFT_468058 [Trametes punicea]
MSRIPPSLLYLTIFNPTLKPAALDADDEDAEELAHVLYYTAREPAPSRDRVLRQVGLAKALVSFSEMFNPGVHCENVHSQARRMIMLSPEPNFWIHAVSTVSSPWRMREYLHVGHRTAEETVCTLLLPTKAVAPVYRLPMLTLNQCYEVAKTPRSPPSTSKSKADPKSKSKGKEKEQASRPTLLYDYHDGSIHDEALRTHLRRGYEMFKLSHGSFTSVLSNLGQEILELQLEMFFTVWAWEWNMEDQDFGTHLGIPLHPLHDKLTLLVEEFEHKLPQESMTLALIPPYVIPPRSSRYPAALVRFLSSRITLRPMFHLGSKLRIEVSSPSAVDASSKAVTSAAPPGVKHQGGPDKDSTGANTLLSVPSLSSLNLGLNMKNLKWSWPDYLTFGKPGAGSKSSTAPQTPSAAADPNTSDAQKEGGESSKSKDQWSHGAITGSVRETLDVDAASLLEAISTESIGAHTRAASPASSTLSRSTKLGSSSAERTPEVPLPDGAHIPHGQDQGESTEVGSLAANSASTLPTDSRSDSTSRETSSFVGSIFHLAPADDPLATHKKRLLHLTRDGCTVAIVVDIDHTLDLTQSANAAVELIQSMTRVLEEDKLRSKEQQIPSAAKILQTEDRYIVAVDEYTTSGSAAFDCRSEHLYNARQLLHSDHDVLEVFSRGQNPQHWYIGKRGLGADADGRAVDGEAYMEVSRKETTLTDVDNELMGVVRRFIEWYK